MRDRKMLSQQLEMNRKNKRKKRGNRRGSTFGCNQNGRKTLIKSVKQNQCLQWNVVGNTNPLNDHFSSLGTNLKPHSDQHFDPKCRKYFFLIGKRKKKERKRCQMVK